MDDIHGFLDTWCPRLGFVPSKIQTWGSAADPTWSEFASVFDQHTGQLMFMVVQGKKGAHADLLQKYGSGSIYRLCFKTDSLQDCFEHLQSAGAKVTNLEGVPFDTFQDVINSGKRILWLEKEGELSMEILTAPIIDAGCEKLRREVGLASNQRHRTWQEGVALAVAFGATFIVGVLVGRASRR